MTSSPQEKTFLARRLTIAIALPILVFLVMGLILGKQLLQMADDAAWVDHTDKVIGLANKTKLLIVEQETALRGFLLTEDEEFLTSVVQADPKPNFDRLNVLVADNQAQQSRFLEIREAYVNWEKVIEPVLTLRDVQAAKSLSAIRDRKSRMDELRSKMRAAIQIEEELRSTRFAAAERTNKRTKIIFVGLLAGVALLLGFLSRKQLGSIATTFSEALSKEKKIREEMEAEVWIRQGHVELSEVMQGDKPTVQIANEILQQLARYVSADVGAFFLKGGRGWVRRASFALDANAAGGESFAVGEGVVGQAAQSGKIVDLRDLPATYFKVRSGTGETSAAQVLVVPLRVEKTTYGVVELGFLRPAQSRVTTLLNRVDELIAIAVRSAEQKERVRDLLEETQRQAEELQTQQEELRVQNEELEQQSRALQESQTNLQNQQAELEQINAQLEEQTQTLEEQRDALIQTQSELKQANDYKSDFLANMSHELRTPLNSTLILAKLLASNREGNLNPEQIKFARAIYSAGNDLLTLINDILDLSKIEAGKLEVKIESVAITRLIDDVTTIFQPVAHEKRLEVSTFLDGRLPATLQTDPLRLQQILKNLLSNALKFTEQGGVEISVSCGESGTVRFAVKDTGIGIPADRLEAIFDAFCQADGMTNRKYGGTGLGLSISRDLAALLGGTLEVQSTPGEGSTFTLIIPEVYIAGEGVIPSRERATPIRRRMAKQTPTAHRLVKAPVSDDREKLKGSRSILIIEDDADFARVIGDLAHELDFEVLLAGTAAEGLSMAEKFKPSAIILDIGLPDRSGLSVLDVLKHNPATRHVPVHAMSGADYTQTAMEIGAVGFAIKPVQREQLVEALKRLESKFTRAPRRVLVVEDDVIHRESTCSLLAADDVETVAVGTASDALRELGSSTFDCMVLDLSLPDRSGFDVLEEMSQKEQVGFPPVIIYTGRNLSKDEEQRIRRYSQSIIIKGARSPERLLDEVTLFLHQVEAELPPDRQRMLRDARNREAVFEGRKVLVVEDDVRNIFALSSILEPKGAKVEIARNGKEALLALKQIPGIDLVLMDIMMPEMDGLEATRQIRKMPEFAKLPIIALTAKAMADDRENSLAAGANDYIAKPLDVDRLLSLVRVWMPK